MDDMNEVFDFRYLRWRRGPNFNLNTCTQAIDKYRQRLFTIIGVDPLKMDSEDALQAHLKLAYAVFTAENRRDIKWEVIMPYLTDERRVEVQPIIPRKHRTSGFVIDQDDYWQVNRIINILCHGYEEYEMYFVKTSMQIAHFSDFITAFLICYPLSLFRLFGSKKEISLEYATSLTSLFESDMLLSRLHIKLMKEVSEDSNIFSHLHSPRDIHVMTAIQKSFAEIA